MKLPIIILGLLSAAGLFGQHKMNWQNQCFMNPNAPYCAQAQFGGKASPTSKDRTSVTSPRAARSAVSPVVGGIDWRFADPSADVVAGLNLTSMSASPLARGLIAQLGARRGLVEADSRKLLAALPDVDRVAVSLEGDRVVFVLTGKVVASTFSGLGAGWKTAPAGTGMLLIGHADAVDRAAQRIAMNGPSSDWAGLAQEQLDADLWAAGSGKLAGPQALGAGVTQVSLTASFRDRLWSGTFFEFSGTPDASTGSMWPAGFGVATVNGKGVQTAISLEAAEVERKWNEIAASPLGDRLSTLVSVGARYLPVHETPVVGKGKAVIYGLDDGPKAVNLAPHP